MFRNSIFLFRSRVISVRWYVRFENVSVELLHIYTRRLLSLILSRHIRSVCNRRVHYRVHISPHNFTSDLDGPVTTLFSHLLSRNTAMDWATRGSTPGRAKNISSSPKRLEKLWCPHSGRRVRLMNHLSSSEVRNKWSLTTISHICVHGVYRGSFIFALDMSTPLHAVCACRCSLCFRRPCWAAPFSLHFLAPDTPLALCFQMPSVCS